jgi:hypothetical protein
VRTHPPKAAKLEVSRCKQRTRATSCPATAASGFSRSTGKHSFREGKDDVNSPRGAESPRVQLHTAPVTVLYTKIGNTCRHLLCIRLARQPQTKMSVTGIEKHVKQSAILKRLDMMCHGIPCITFVAVQG